MTKMQSSRSFRGRLWRLPEIDPAAVAALIESGVPHAAAPILAARGLSPSDAADYVEPTLRALLPNPSFFRDMDKAVARLGRAVEAGEKIAIWGDYDVDGATSSALLRRFLRQCGSEAMVYIPDRIKEGYGPNAPGLIRLRQEGAEVVCILDSGIVAFEPIAAAQAAGLDCIVIDHHAAEARLPEAVAVVNPNRLDQEKGYGHVCAAGMTFLLCVGVNAYLRERGHFDRVRTRPELMELVDLVALGTVADVVPLVGVNRAFVKRGLEIMSRRRNPGIAALGQVARLDGPFSTAHCGFVLGPRINAGGRVGFAGAGADLLSSEDATECRRIAELLDKWNSERQLIEKNCVAEAVAQVEARIAARGGADLVVFAAGDDWHEGVIGIVASRLKEIYDRPAFCFARTPDGRLKGSARSVVGFDIGAAVLAARNAGLLEKGGGHPMAAGVTLEPGQYEAFHEFLCARAAESAFGRLGVVAPVDLVLPVDRVSIGLVDSFAVMEPYGQGNPSPRVLVTGARLAKAEVLKDKAGNPAHLRIELESPLGARLKGIEFSIIGSPVADGLLASVGRRVDVLGRLEVNEFNGYRTPQLRFEDAREAE